MSEAAPLLFERHDQHIAVVTINRPSARNAVNAAVAEALEQAVERVESESDIRVAILTGAGASVFCAGADLKEVSSGRIGTLMRDKGGFAGFVDSKRSKPWIAAVDGLALAGGCELALACDMIVASQDGAFGLPEVTRGLIASAGGLYRLPRTIPRAIATEMILTANRLSATRAAEFGMVNQLAPAGEVLPAALTLAKSIVANAPLAVSASLMISRLASDVDDAALKRLSDETQDRISKTEDFFEGSRAFVEKRPPQWKNR
jgi:enoyl-CoA hydratase